MIVMLVIAVLVVSFVLLLFGFLLAPSSVNRLKLGEHDCTRLEILQVPHIFLKRWYEPTRLYVRRMVIMGTIGLMVGFISLFLISQLGISLN